jgi:hypothetical protein
MTPPIHFIMYADFSQIVVLDSGVNLFEMTTRIPFWASENPQHDLFSIRMEHTAVSVGGMNKDYTLVDVFTEENHDAPLESSNWVRREEMQLHLPSGTLWITEIIDMEPPRFTLPLEPGWYTLRVSISDYDWDKELPLPIGVTCDEPVRQQVRLELLRTRA